MASWLKRLSVAFVVAGAAGASFAALHGKEATRLTTDAAKIQPAFKELVDQGKLALRAFVESPENQQAAVQTAAPRQRLPLIVIEPRDFAAPTIRLPSVQGPTAQLAQATPPPRQPAPVTLSAGRSQLDLNPVERGSAPAYRRRSLSTLICSSTSARRRLIVASGRSACSSWPNSRTRPTS